MSRFERRRSPRRLVAVPCSVAPAVTGAASLDTHVVEISAGGAQLACVGLEGLLRLRLRTSAGELRLTGRVVREDPGRTAVRFEGLTPADRRSLAALTGPHPQAAAA